MAKISRNKPVKAIEDLMWRRLIEVFREAKDDESVIKILDDLLTPSEKVIFGKRLLIALFLSKGLSYQQISNCIKVSSATINSIQNTGRRHGKGFSVLIKEMNKKESSKLDKLLEGIFEEIGYAVNKLERAYTLRPRKTGSRWSWVNRL